MADAAVAGLKAGASKALAKMELDQALAMLTEALAAGLPNVMWIEYFMADNALLAFQLSLIRGPETREVVTDEGVFLAAPTRPGLGIELDPDNALDYYRRAAEGGHCAAVKRMMSIAQNGELGVSPDAEEAKSWEARLDNCVRR